MDNKKEATEKRAILDDWKSAVDQAFLRATHDALTGLPNRFLFQDRLRTVLAEARRHQEMAALLFIDIDRFKDVNELLGHTGGDRILASVGARLLRIVRSEETIARVGGDEFIALIRRLRSPQDAEIVAARLLKALDLPLQLDGVTASIGISLYPFDGEDAQTLVQRADSAMFRVKSRGGNGFEFFEKPIGSLSKETVPEPQKPREILIVEDDPDFQFLLRKRLEKEGYSCLSAACVEKALTRVSAHVPDLVILDLGLHGASGLAFLKDLSRAVAQEEKVPPVLVVSGHNDPEIIEFATTLGASCFLPKPVESNQVISAVRSFLH